MSIMQSSNGIGITNGARSSSMPGLRGSGKSYLFSSWISVQGKGILQNR
jgi:hypothetical protein